MNTFIVGMANHPVAAAGSREDVVVLLLAAGLAFLAHAAWRTWKGPDAGELSLDR